jgi:hypothetical protein
MPEFFVFLILAAFSLVSWGLLQLCQNLMEAK